MTALPRLAYGGDYNPEQWPPTVWERGRPPHAGGGCRPGHRGHLLLGAARAAGGRLRLRLARPRRRAAARGRDRRRPGDRHRRRRRRGCPPAPRDAAGRPRDGATLWPGGRQAFCPSSPVFRRARRCALCRAMAERYGSHPARRAVARLQRARLPQRPVLLRRQRRGVPALAARRYGDVDALNAAWGTAFWSQRYASLDEMLPPRAAPTSPTRPSSSTSRGSAPTSCSANFVAERDVLHELSPGVPVTTNFMVMRDVQRAWTTGAGPPSVDVVVQRPLPRPPPTRRATPSWPSRPT